jgi:hypothetical protein
VYSFETLVTVYQTPRCYHPEYCDLNFTHVKPLKQFSKRLQNAVSITRFAVESEKLPLDHGAPRTCSNISRDAWGGFSYPTLGGGAGGPYPEEGCFACQYHNLEQLTLQTRVLPCGTQRSRVCWKSTDHLRRRYALPKSRLTSNGLCGLSQKT